MSREVDRPLAPSPTIKGYGSVSRDDTRWDYVMVFPNPPKETIEANDQRDAIIGRLRTAGLETKLFYSLGGELVFCKIRAHEELLKDEAESIRMHLQLDPDQLRRASAEGLPQYNIAPFPIRDVKRQYSYNPFEYIFAAYMQHKELQKFYLKKGKNGSLFGSTERLALIESIITDHGNGAGCDIERLIYDEVIVECFPLHETDQMMDLKQQWIVWNTSPMNQPFDRICNYFGVKISLYFLYLGHYTKWLLYPALVGLIPGILDYLVPRTQHKAVFSYLSPAFGAFMTLWMSVYLESWKRLNARETLRWGTSNFTQIVQMRPQFQGEKIPSPINGKPTRYFSPREKFKRVAYSWIVISFLILVVFGLVFATFVLRYDLTKGDAADELVVYHIQLGPMIAATINVVQITIMTKIYGVVSIFLNDQENHRTDIEYENSLIVKTVIFQFVNNYSALFYVAFLKDSMEGCTISCMYELEYTVAIVYCSRLFIGNMTEVAIPRFWVYFNQYRLIGKLTGAADPEIEAKKSAAERELFMSQYDWRGTFDDYTEMALQFGYTTMFVVSFPFAPLLSYLNNYFEIRLDAYRLIFESRRPRPYNVRDIGSWYQVLQAMAAISICTNGGVVIFTGNYFNGVSVAMRVWYFTMFTGSMFFFKYLLEVCISDTPESVIAQRKRAEFLISKCLFHVPDEDTYRPVLLEDDEENPNEDIVIHDEDVHDMEC